MIDPTHVGSLLILIGVQQTHWKVAAERSVLAYMMFYPRVSLHKVRFGGLSDRSPTESNATRSGPDSDNSESATVSRTTVRMVQWPRGNPMEAVPV
jgi:hypothetical protein